MHKHSYLDDTKSQILELINALGKRSMYRYLRDHNMLDQFVKTLPMQNWEATDEAVIHKYLFKSWDDYSKEKLDSMRKWHAQESLSTRIAAYAGQLSRKGFRTAAIQLLGIAANLDQQAQRDVVVKQAHELQVGDIITASDEGVGFTKRCLPGKITRISKSANHVNVAVFIAQTEQRIVVGFPSTSQVTIAKLVKPMQARALQAKALQKLLQVEQSIVGTNVQPKLARICHILQTNLEKNS